MADVMSVDKRRALMSRIRGKNTSPERQVFDILKAQGISFSTHERILPGCIPDIVVERCKIAVFVDGDFWHGWRFPSWEHKLAPFWRAKIAGNRARDRRNFSRLRRRGWTVIRIWEHELKRAPAASVQRMILRVQQTLAGTR